MLTTLKLHNMPPTIPPCLMAQLKTLTLLQHLQVTISYTLRFCTYVVFPPVRRHSLQMASQLDLIAFVADFPNIVAVRELMRCQLCLFAGFPDPLAAGQ